MRITPAPAAQAMTSAGAGFTRRKRTRDHLEPTPTPTAQVTQTRRRARFAGKSDAHDSASTLQQLDVTPATVVLTQAFTCPYNPEAAPLLERDDGNVLEKMPDWIVQTPARLCLHNQR